MNFSKFAVIGVGRYGSTIARTLARKGAQVYAFDPSEERIDNIKDDVTFSVALDATDDKALKSQDLHTMDAVVVAIGENFQATVLVCVHLMDLGVKRIIARASGAHQKLILKKIGVQEVLAPEDEVANAVTEKLINPSVVNFLQLPDEFEVTEVKAPKGVVGRPVSRIKFKEQYGLTLITINREYPSKVDGEIIEHVVDVNDGDPVIMEKDTLFLYGTARSLTRFLDINEA